jgi:glycosyltransferase involved in cell wall biosynthesis
MKIGYLMQAGVPDIRSDPSSGPAVHVKRVIEELAKLGHQVRLLAAFDQQLWKSDDLASYVPVTAPLADHGILRLMERGLRRIQHDLRIPYAALFESLRFALVCKQELDGYDLLYERMGWFGYGAGLAAKWLSVPLVLEINGDPLTEMETQGTRLRPAQRWLSTALMKKAATWPSHAVASGEGWRRQYIERWPVDPSKVTVVQNGSELVQLLSRSQLRAFCSNTGREDVTTIAYSGSFDPWQGVLILLRAVARVISGGTRVRLLLIGSGPGVKSATQLAQELRLGSNVHFVGQLQGQEYAACLAEADLGVVPYCGRSEFSGLKLMDYKAAGLAVIASGNDGQPGVIEHGRTGWIVPPCDEDALCQAIRSLCADRELARSMGRASRVEAEQLHSWKNTALELTALFERVISEDQRMRRGLARG